MRTRRLVASTAATILAATMLAGCGSEPGVPADPAAAATPSVEATTSDSDLAEETTASESPAPTEALEEAFGGPTLTVQVSGDRVRPNAVDLEVGKGEPLRIRVEADRAGELHVHSSPEQYVDFDAGRSTTRVRFQRAGVVEIEEHDSGQVIALVTVS